MLLAPALWALIELIAQGIGSTELHSPKVSSSEPVPPEPVPEDSTASIVPPQLLHFENVDFPQDVAEISEPVEVMLALDIDTDGLVERAEVIGAAPDPFAELAQNAALLFVFEPARLGKEAIAVQIRFNYVFKPPKPTVVISSGNLHGVVLSEGNKALSQVRLRLVELDLWTTTDKSGKFDFAKIPFGDYTIELSGENLAPKTIATRLETRKSERLRVDMRRIELETSQPLEIDDNAVVRGLRVDNEAIETRVSSEQAQYAAGNQGDAIKVIHTLAGVARPVLGTGELAIWGAAPDDSRLYVDWVPIPRLFHLGGIRSIVGSRFVSSVDLVPGGFAVDNGRAIGGLVRVKTIDLSDYDRDHPELLGGYASIDPIDFSAGTRVSLSESTKVFLAARRSLQRQTFARIAPEPIRQLVPLSDYGDYQLKIFHRISEQSHLELIGFGASDQIRREIPSLARNHEFHELHSESFQRVAARLVRNRNDGSSTFLQLWWGKDKRQNTQTFTDVEAIAGKDSQRVGLRIAENRRVHPVLQFKIGLDAEFEQATHQRHGAISLPAREGDSRVWGQHPGNRVNHDQWGVVALGMAGYASVGLDLLRESLTIEGGLRVEANVVSGDRILPVRPIEPQVGYTRLHVAVDPRLRANWQSKLGVNLFAAIGRYHQPASTSDLSPVFGNPTLKPEQALQILSGINVRPITWLKLELVGFWISQHQLSSRSELPTPGTAQLLQSTGRGRNMGLQASLRLSWNETIYAWLSYSLMQAQRQDVRGQSWRRFDGDQTHILQSWASWQHRSGFDLGLKVQLNSGYPRTPVVDAVFDSSAGRYDPVFGPKNSTRLPLYFSLSLRLGWQKQFCWGQFKAWFDVQNLTNHQNGEEFYYRSDYGQRGIVRGIPIFPLLGMEVSL